MWANSGANLVRIFSPFCRPLPKTSAKDKGEQVSVGTTMLPGSGLKVAGEEEEEEKKVVVVDSIDGPHEP